MKVIRTPSWARKYFDANALSGWPNGVRFEVRGKNKRRIKYQETRTIMVVCARLKIETQL